MADPTPLPGLEDKIRRVNDRRLNAGGGNGHGPTDGIIQHRVSALEKSFEKMDGKLDKIIDRLQNIDARLVHIETQLEHKASAADVASIKGRVDALPTTWQMITLAFGILGGAFLMLRFGLPHSP